MASNLSIPQLLDAAFRRAIFLAFDIEADPIIAPVAQAQFGDYQSNCAMPLAKRITDSTGQKTNPRQIAEAVKARLDLGEMVSEITIAGPGFINVRLNPIWLAQRLDELKNDARLGASSTQNPQTVVIDYSAPNVAKEMHVGHLRSTIIGDCFARVLDFLGHKVIRQNHIGDWGTQFGMLIAFAWRIGLYKPVKVTGGSFVTTDETLHVKAGMIWESLTKLEDVEVLYREAKALFDANEEFRQEARSVVVRLQAGDPDVLSTWRQIVNQSIHHARELYVRMNIQLADDRVQDVPLERGESFYNAMLSEVVGDLVRAHLVGESEGAMVAFVEGYEAPLIVQKSDGGFGYATTDLAAVRFRVSELGANRIVYVVGAPQSQHFQQVFATARKAGWANDVALEHAAFGSVLGEDGKIFRTRAGGTVKLADLLDEAETRAFDLVTAKTPDLPETERKAIAHDVGIGAVKYFDLLRDRISDYKFSFDAMLSMDGNTAPYLQYAHARVRSIFRKAESSSISFDRNVPIQLEEPTEISLAKSLLRFGETIEGVARELKPHFLCTYLYELSGKFSAFYEACHVLTSDEPIRSSRLALCDITARTLALGLGLLGIGHPERM